MIALKGLDHIGIRVADFKRTVKFYRQFGFEVTREDFNERVVVLRHASGLELNLLDSAVHQHQPHNVLMDEDVKHAGYTHIALQVADITHAALYVTALGIAITEGPVTFGDGKTSIFFRDPDRNVIELTQSALMHVSHSDVEQEVKA
jgi:lactoylglutathione lyase